MVTHGSQLNTQQRKIADEMGWDWDWEGGHRQAEGFVLQAVDLVPPAPVRMCC